MEKSVAGFQVRLQHRRRIAPVAARTEMVGGGHEVRLRFVMLVMAAGAALRFGHAQRRAAVCCTWSVMLLWHWVQALSGTRPNSEVWHTEQLSSAAERCAGGQRSAGPEGIGEHEAAEVLRSLCVHGALLRQRLHGLAQQQRQHQPDEQHHAGQHPAHEALRHARLRQLGGEGPLESGGRQVQGCGGFPPRPGSPAAARRSAGDGPRW